MGYRSDVDIFMKEEDWKRLIGIADASKNQEFKELTTFFSEEDSFKFEGHKWVHMYATDLKWYDFYDSVTRFMETLEEIGQCVYIRIGEELGDVEHIAYEDEGEVPSIYPVTSVEYDDNRIER